MTINDLRQGSSAGGPVTNPALVANQEMVYSMMLQHLPDRPTKDPNQVVLDFQDEIFAKFRLQEEEASTDATKKATPQKASLTSTLPS